MRPRQRLLAIQSIILPIISYGAEGGGAVHKDGTTWLVDVGGVPRYATPAFDGHGPDTEPRSGAIIHQDGEVQRPK